jgi:hypothetical protein
MKRFMFSLFVGALVLAMVPAVQAKGGSSKGGSSHKGSSSKGSSHHTSKGSNHQAHNDRRHDRDHDRDRDRNRDRDRDRDHDRDHDRYYRTHLKKASFGSYFKGKDPAPWWTSKWSSKYGCKCYFDRECGGWFYRCVPDDCYYPLTYCPYGRYTFDEIVVSSTEDTVEVEP